MTLLVDRLDRARAVAVGLAAVVGALTIAAASGAFGAGSIDARITAHTHGFMLNHGGLVHACRVVTWLGAPLVVDVFVAVAAIAFWFAGHRSAAIYLVAVRVLAQLCSTLLKHAVGRERPDFAHSLIHVAGFGFPSGHATGAASTYLPVAVVLCTIVQRSATRRALVAVAVAVCLVVAATRVLLGAHYLSDVLAGLALGGAVAAACWRLSDPQRVSVQPRREK